MGHHAQHGEIVRDPAGSVGHRRAESGRGGSPGRGAGAIGLGDEVARGREAPGEVVAVTLARGLRRGEIDDSLPGR